jgi:hypothetical protein
MLLYKAVQRNQRIPMINGMIFMSPSVEGAFMWASTLFGDAPYFINEYKIPNSEPVIYNTGSYRWSNGNWTGGDGIVDPVELGDIPDLPDTGQIAILSDDMDYEYRQVAYFDGKNLISKNKNDAARITISHQAGQIAANVDKLDIMLNMIQQYIEDYDITKADGVQSVVDGTSKLFDTIIQLLDGMVDVDGLTVDFSDYLDRLGSQLDKVQHNELSDLIKLSKQLVGQDDESVLSDMSSLCTSIQDSTNDIIDDITNVDFLEPTNKTFYPGNLFKSLWY